MSDLSHLNELANEHYFETDRDRKSILRQRLWEGAHELIKHLNVECKVMDRDDLIQELTMRLVRNPEPVAEQAQTEESVSWKPEKAGSQGNGKREKPGWIDTYNPNKDQGAGFVGYIAANAKLATRNLYRDNRDGGFSRRALEAKNQVLRLIDKDKMTLRAAKAKVVVDMNLGMDLLSSLDAALRSEDSARSLDFPINPEGTQSLQDVLPGELIDPAVHIDRTEIKVNLDTLPPRYSKILQGIMDGKDPFTEIDFGTGLSLSAKAVMIDTALKLLASKLESKEDGSAA